MSTDMQQARKDAIADAVAEAYTREGYVTEGEPDQQLLAEAIYQRLTSVVVQSEAERTTSSITRGALVAAVFPSLPQREAWPAEPDPALAEDVWMDVLRKV